MFFKRKLLKKPEEYLNLAKKKFLKNAANRSMNINIGASKTEKMRSCIFPHDLSGWPCNFYACDFYLTQVPSV